MACQAEWVEWISKPLKNKKPGKFSRALLLSFSITYIHKIQQQLKDSLSLLKMILGSDLFGVYLYGSAFVGGLQKYSDIDHTARHFL